MVPGRPIRLYWMQHAPRHLAHHPNDPAVTVEGALDRARWSRADAEAVIGVLAAVTMMTVGPGGYMHMLPVQVEQNTVADAVVASTLPWQTPGLLAVQGRSDGDSGSPLLAICYEWPISWLRTTEAIGQFNLEWLYLQRYRTLMAASTRQSGTGVVGSRSRSGASLGPHATGTAQCADHRCRSR